MNCRRYSLWRNQAEQNPDAGIQLFCFPSNAIFSLYQKKEETIKFQKEDNMDNIKSIGISRNLTGRWKGWRKNEQIKQGI